MVNSSEILIGIANNTIKQLVDFPEYYISNDGRCFSYKNKKRTKRDWHELNGFVNRTGYKYVDLVCVDKKKRIAVHQLVALYFCDKPDDAIEVNHKDANKLNNHYTNLEWCTRAYNVRQSYITSGINQTRNYCTYYLLNNNDKIGPFLTYPSVIRYIEKENLDIAIYSLRNLGKSRGWSLLVYDKKGREVVYKNDKRNRKTQR